MKKIRYHKNIDNSCGYDARSILLHVCCGPCSIVPVLRLRASGYNVTALFANPNIHPLSEYLRRRDAMQLCAEKLDLPVVWLDAAWDIHSWLADVAGAKSGTPARCSYCYATRLDMSARKAQELGFQVFTSSLCYSRYQDHKSIQMEANRAALAQGVAFYYEDFSDEWQKGIDISKEFGLYRQAYCGCIYSEAERYAKKLRAYTRDSMKNLPIQNV